MADWFEYSTFNFSCKRSSKIFCNTCGMSAGGQIEHFS